MIKETLLRLLANSQVCAADFRCLVCKSKQCLRRLCIQNGSGCRKRDSSNRPGVFKTGYRDIYSNRFFSKDIKLP